MPAAIPDEIRNRAIKQWFYGDTRAKIASDNNIGEGSVTNIVSDFNRGMVDPELGSIREFAVESRKQGLTLGDLGPRLRLYNYIKKLGADGDQIESFIANCMNGVDSFPPEKIIDLTNQLFDIAKSESIPPAEIPSHINQKLEEKQKLEKQIQEADALLHTKNVDIETINEFIKLKERLSKQNLSLEDPTRLLSILQTIQQIGYEPQKIVAAFTNIKSLRQKERQLKSNCEILEKRMSDARQVLPLLQQIRSMGIGIDKILVFSVAVNEKAQAHNLPISAAAYRVIEDIENYNRIGGMNKEICRLAVQIYGMNEICAPRNKAITSLLKLQNYGITDDEICMCVNEFLNRAL
jgi:hypothetical protein